MIRRIMLFIKTVVTFLLFLFFFKFYVFVLKSFLKNTPNKNGPEFFNLQSQISNKIKNIFIKSICFIIIIIIIHVGRRNKNKCKERPRSLQKPNKSKCLVLTRIG